MRYKGGVEFTRLQSSGCLRFNPDCIWLIFDFYSSEGLQLYPRFLLLNHIVWACQYQMMNAHLLPVGSLKQELVGLR